MLLPDNLLDTAVAALRVLIISTMTDIRDQQNSRLYMYGTVHVIQCTQQSMQCQVHYGACGVCQSLSANAM